MNRVIQSGSWCIFRLNPAGTRKQELLLAQLRDFTDPTEVVPIPVKRYHSESTSLFWFQKSRFDRRSDEKRVFLTRVNAR